MSLSIETIPISEFLSLSPIVEDYLNESEKLKPLINGYQRLADLKSQIEQKQSNFTHRELLVSRLTHQNEKVCLHSNQIENINALHSSNTFTITTAHQTNVFGGPLYFVQKAISTIKACQLAKSMFPEYVFVPIFWMGTEDHDFEELNHTYAFQTDFVWNDKQGGAFGRYQTQSLAPLVKQLTNKFDNSEHGTFLTALFESAYLKHNTVAAATRYLLTELLGEQGLVVIDGDDVELKRIMIPTFEREILSQFSSKAAKPTMEWINEHYGGSQAFAREINLFYLTSHDRNRIIQLAENEFGVKSSKKRWSSQEIIAELNEFPEQFSPNVMLRPLMQELCLPNLMYVGGGGELSYWFQLKAIFEATNVTFPLLALRDSAVYLTRKSTQKLGQLGLTVPSFLQSKQELTKAIIQEHTEHELQLDKPRKLIREAMQLIEHQARQIDFTLKASSKAEEQKMINSLHKLEKKMMRAEKKNHQVALTRMNVVYENMYPKGKLQERILNFSELYLEYGTAWIDWQLEHFNLFDQQAKIMLEH